MPAITLSKTTWTKIVSASTKRIELFIHNVDATAANRIYITDSPKPTTGPPSLELGEGGIILFGTDMLKLNAKDTPKARGAWWAFSPLANASLTLQIYEASGVVIAGRPTRVARGAPPPPIGGDGVGFPSHYPV